MKCFLFALVTVAVVTAGCGNMPYKVVDKHYRSYEGPTPPPKGMFDCDCHKKGHHKDCKKEEPAPKPKCYTPGLKSIGRLKLLNPQAADFSGHFNGSAMPPKPEKDLAIYKTDWWGNVVVDYWRNTTRIAEPRETSNGTIVWATRDDTHESLHKQPAPTYVVARDPIFAVPSVPAVSLVSSGGGVVGSGGGYTYRTPVYSGFYGTPPLSGP